MKSEEFQQSSKTSARAKFKLYYYFVVFSLPSFFPPLLTVKDQIVLEKRKSR